MSNRPLQVQESVFPGYLANTAVPPMVCDATHLPPEAMTTAYEAGKVLLFAKGIDLGLTDNDFRFINEIDPPEPDRKGAKKAKLRALLAEIPDDYKQHILGAIVRSPKQARRLQELVVSVTEKMQAYVQTWFPGYRIVNADGATWRFTRTEAESMHYDSYGTATDELHHVRLFVNLDNQPRLWGVSYPVSDILSQYCEQLRPAFNMHPNLLNAQLNKLLPWDELPRHYVAFPPGSAWLVNSQIVAHEIIYGRKMVAYTFDIDPTSMQNPERNFVNVVRNTIASLK
jgi:hypothetical protein